MRGFPLLRVLCVACALLLLGVPVWMLARDRADEAIAPAAEVPGEAGMADFNVVMSVTSPASLSVGAANHGVRKSGAGVRRFEARFDMPRLQPEDLAVSADCDADNGPVALRVEVRSGGRLLADRTFWGQGEIHDVVEVAAP